MKDKKATKTTGKCWAVMAPNLTGRELKNLSKKIEKSLVDPNYVIITNYEFHIIEIPWGCF